MRKVRKDFGSNNISGITGVCEVFTDKESVFIASWREDYAPYTCNKWFSYNIASAKDRLRARNEAIAHRNLMVKEHYDE